MLPKADAKAHQAPALLLAAREHAAVAAAPGLRKVVQGLAQTALLIQVKALAQRKADAAGQTHAETGYAQTMRTAAALTAMESRRSAIQIISAQAVLAHTQAQAEHAVMQAEYAMPIVAAHTQTAGKKQEAAAPQAIAAQADAILNLQNAATKDASQGKHALTALLTAAPVLKMRLRLHSGTRLAGIH